MISPIQDGCSRHRVSSAPHNGLLGQRASYAAVWGVCSVRAPAQVYPSSLNWHACWYFEQCGVRLADEIYWSEIVLLITELGSEDHEAAASAFWRNPAHLMSHWSEVGYVRFSQSLPLYASKYIFIVYFPIICFLLEQLVFLGSTLK